MPAPPPNPPPMPPKPTPSVGWPRSMQLGLAFVLGAFALILMQHVWQRSGRPAEIVAPTVYLIDLNEASKAELAQLPGVGPGLAQRIEDHRRTRQPFRSVEELNDVPGIGPKLMERLKKNVVVRNSFYESLEKSSFIPPSAFADAQTPSSIERAKKIPPTEPIDLNLAPKEELMRLPGIGPSLADRIVKDRIENGPYRNVSDITRVKGIKGKTLEKIRPFVRVGNTGFVKPMSS